MTSSQRIILNTLATYGRTVFAMVLGLFSSRWVLQSLGDIDYGLMGVVGSLIVFITFLNNIMSNSCGRFFALSIGRGDADETNRWFNTALSIHVFLPTLLVLIGWPVGEWAIRNFLNIPLNRLDTARWVFRFSLAAAFCGMSLTPYIAMYTAKQNIAEFSLWGGVNSFVNFGFVFWLTTYKGDTWMVYAGWSVLISVILTVGQVFRAHYLFPECRINMTRWLEPKRLVQVFSFSGWQLFGGISSLLSSQGIAILLNRFFPPSVFPHVNASYSVGTAISGYTQAFSGALLGAFTPEITATEGMGDRRRMLFLIDCASKFGTYLVLLFAIPLLLEMDYVLHLWLRTPPKMAGIFCTLLLIQFVIDKLTYGYMVGIAAYGRIAIYQLILGCFSLSVLPVSWLFLTLGFPPASAIVVFTIMTVCYSIARIFLAKWLIGASPSMWFIHVLIPILVSVVLSGTIGGLVHFLIDGSLFLRFILTSAASFVTLVVVGWWFVLTTEERQYVVVHVIKLRNKLCILT